MAFETVGRVCMLRLETSDHDHYVWCFSDYASLNTFWAQEIVERLDSWMESEHEDKWIELLNHDDMDFVEQWSQYYGEWWSYTDDNIMRYIDAGRALKEVCDGQDQDRG